MIWLRAVHPGGDFSEQSLIPYGASGCFGSTCASSAPGRPWLSPHGWLNRPGVWAPVLFLRPGRRPPGSPAGPPPATWRPRQGPQRPPRGRAVPAPGLRLCAASSAQPSSRLPRAAKPTASAICHSARRYRPEPWFRHVWGGFWPHSPGGRTDGRTGRLSSQPSGPRALARGALSRVAVMAAEAARPSCRAWVPGGSGPRRVGGRGLMVGLGSRAAAAGLGAAGRRHCRGARTALGSVPRSGGCAGADAPRTWRGPGLLGTKCETLTNCHRASQVGSNNKFFRLVVFNATFWSLRVDLVCGQ